MAVDKDEVMSIKAGVDACEMCCQCCVFMFNLIAFGLWMQLGTMYSVVHFTTCTVGGGVTFCDYVMSGEAADEAFSLKVYEPGADLMGYLVVVKDDSPIRSAFLNISEGAYVDDTSGWVGLEQYTPEIWIASAVLVALVGMAMRGFDKAMSYNEDANFCVRKGTTGCIMVLGTALAGSLSCVSCIEVKEGLWESSLTNTATRLWFAIFGCLVIAACGGCAMLCEAEKTFYISLCCGSMMFLTVFFLSIYIVFMTTVGPDGTIDWSLSFEKLAIGAGNDCLSNGDAKVGGIKALTILALTCGIFQKIAMVLFTCFDCCNSAARVVDGE
mmetsp:Transcript_43466/g.120816  ORF Transcript_43466/g.120816 Transcript_43466/m.120816 type:complete len:327 (-) Transcript_43466:20-1000(-)